MRTTPTWMSRAAKVVATFDAPFWREHGLAGRVVSTAGPVHDWHDATTPDGHAALHGFMHPPGLSSPTPADPRARLDAIRRQLVHCFGPDASPTALFAWDWSGDPLTMPPGGSRSDPDEPPAPRPVLQRPRWDGRLHLAGAETATEHPGYLDGAIEAGTRAARRLLSS